MSETATERQPLTARQEEVYWAIVRHWRDNGVYPTLRELFPAIGTGSTNAVAAHLTALAKKGWIEWDRTTKSRGIRIPELQAAARAAATTLLLSRTARAGASSS